MTSTHTPFKPRVKARVKKVDPTILPHNDSELKHGIGSREVQYAYELKRVHSQLRELTDSKDAVDDRDPYELPIDYDHDKNFHGHYFLPDLEGVDDLRHETNLATAVTYSINRIERGTTRLTQQRYEHLKPSFLNASKKVIENAINATTQHANDLLAGPTIKNVHRSRNPACNELAIVEIVSFLRRK